MLEFDRHQAIEVVKAERISITALLTAYRRARWAFSRPDGAGRIEERTQIYRYHTHAREARARAC